MLLLADGQLLLGKLFHGLLVAGHRKLGGVLAAFKQFGVHPLALLARQVVEEDGDDAQQAGQGGDNGTHNEQAVLGVVGLRFADAMVFDNTTSLGTLLVMTMIVVFIIGMIYVYTRPAALQASAVGEVRNATQT